ncbi:MAG: hypothetical protein Q9174_004612 [Haloplaca sp. 1 TL-2023]
MAKHIDASWTKWDSGSAPKSPSTPRTISRVHAKARKEIRVAAAPPIMNGLRLPNLGPGRVLSPSDAQRQHEEVPHALRLLFLAIEVVEFVNRSAAADGVVISAPSLRCEQRRGFVQDFQRRFATSSFVEMLR